jgi:hypothetical protein
LAPKAVLFRLVQLLLLGGIASLFEPRPTQAMLFILLSMLAFRFLFRFAIHLSARE